jgi:hypothetical protein
MHWRAWSAALSPHYPKHIFLLWPIKKTISKLENNGEILEDNASMLAHAKDFYQSLFGKESRRDFKLDHEFWEEDELVKSEENELLEAQFSEEEIKKAIFDSYAEGAMMASLFFFIKSFGLSLSMILWL